MDTIRAELASLARHLRARREAMLQAWQSAIKRDPRLSTSDALPRVQLFDHIPEILSAFERELCSSAADTSAAGDGVAQEPAAAHGLQRWRQGYDLREVTRELGKLNECVIAELDSYATSNPSLSNAAIAAARRIWSALCSTGIEESVGQYFELQQTEAAGHVKDLESALADLRALEQQRADLWRQAAHDLRGNLGVVANATVGLTQSGLRESSRDDFVRILMRNVTSLHHLLEDVTNLARLQAGREKRQIEPLDATAILEPLCDGIRSLAEQRGLYVRCQGPSGLAVDGDAVKLRRIAQNLVLNGVKYTRAGGVTVTWGNSAPDDPDRWALTIQDTGPGFHTDSGRPLAEVLDPASDPLPSAATAAGPSAGMAAPPPPGIAATPDGGARVSVNTPVGRRGAQPLHSEAGEGIGLSIVKRLCEMLDAEIEMQSVKDVGTTFRVLFPRRYPS